jgi:hypothetical protein
MNISQKKSLYCSPEVFNALKAGKPLDNVDLAKEDTWQLSMCLLEIFAGKSV